MVDKESIQDIQIRNFKDQVIALAKSVSVLEKEAEEQAKELVKNKKIIEALSDLVCKISKIH